jgi:hypothetical protein
VKSLLAIIAANVPHRILLPAVFSMSRTTFNYEVAEVSIVFTHHSYITTEAAHLHSGFACVSVCHFTPRHHRYGIQEDIQVFLICV